MAAGNDALRKENGMNIRDKMAEHNIKLLRNNPYPGRGLILGRIGNDFLVQVYWIMGRSENSRNRVFTRDENGRVFTEAADSTKVKDPSLILYNVMKEKRGVFVASNGHQTDAFSESLGAMSIEGELASYTYEPDAPNFTPRITGVWHLSSRVANISILRKSIWGEACDRCHYRYDHIEPGFGFGITTYSGEGDPLPSFLGDPILFPLTPGICELTDMYWNAL
ncbi:MAG: IMP cyclohydrolase, partial [bacterium]|nr:IMP cyclohydrolase [bacterium]